MKDDDYLRGEIYASMQLKTTDELLKIWEENDREEWTPLAFDVVKEILKQRVGEEPSIQVDHKSRARKVEKTTFLKLPKNKLISATSIGYIVIFFILIIFSPKGLNEQDNIIVYLCVLGLGVCLSMWSAVMLYHAWSLASKDFREWEEDQAMFSSARLKNLRRALIPDWYLIWNVRLIGPLVFLAGLALVAFALILISNLLFG